MQGPGGDSDDDVDPGGTVDQAGLFGGSQFMSLLSDTQVAGEGVFPDSQESMPLTGNNLIPMPKKVQCALCGVWLSMQTHMSGEG